MSPAKQIHRFVKAHPGEWRAACLSPVYPCTGSGCGDLGRVAVLYLPGDCRVRLIPNKDNVGIEIREYLTPWQILPRVDEGAPLLTRIATHIADVLQAHGGSADTLPPWLADPVRRQLRTRAGELLTLAGSSPADVVSAAETVDEELCKRPVVEVTGVLRALMAIGMSCRWATGADEAADDYVGFVSRRLDVVAGERDALAARMSAANGELLRLDGVVTPEIMGEVLWNLRRVLGLP